MTNNELRKLAEAATPGEWYYLREPRGFYSTAMIKCGDGYIAGDGIPLSSERDAAFMAAASPATVLALLDRIAEMEDRLRRIAKPHKNIAYCADGHEESVLIARAGSLR